MASSKDFQHCLEFKEDNPDNALSKKARGKLIAAIVEYTTSNFIWVEQPEFPELFKRIKMIFPHEALDNYYTPTTSVTTPGGKLFNAFRYGHQMLQKETGISKRKRSEKKLGKASPNNESTLKLVENEALRKELIGRMDPWEEIKDLWVKTFAYRRSEIEDESVNRAEIIKRWSKMEKKRGHELVSSTFVVRC